MPPRTNPFRAVWRWIADQIVQEVPEDSALCAMDCRKGQCTMGEWSVCERRIHRAAGERMPAEEIAPEPALLIEATEANEPQNGVLPRVAP